jgi:hypothetical protein
MKNMYSSVTLYYALFTFLGAFAKKKKIAKITDWLRNVRLCVRVYQLGSSWTDFRGITYWETSTKI